MEGLRIIDLLKDEGPFNFENTGLILITNITKSNIESAVKIAKSAKSSQNITVGILSGNINPLNHDDMKRFFNHSDAVIQLSGENNEYSACLITEEISDLITNAGFVNLGLKDVKEIFRDAGTVYFGAATAKSAAVAALKVSEKYGNITGAKRVLLKITTGSGVALGELSEASRFIEINAAPEAQIIWGHVIDDTMRGNVRVSVLAVMNDKNSETRNENLSEVYKNLKHIL